MTSTNGTPATMPLNTSGSIFATAPINSPPALPPIANILSSSAYLLLAKYLALSIKSQNVFFLLNIFPSSYHDLPKY